MTEAASTRHGTWLYRCLSHTSVMTADSDVCAALRMSAAANCCDQLQTGIE